MKVHSQVSWAEIYAEIIHFYDIGKFRMQYSVTNFRIKIWEEVEETSEENIIYYNMVGAEDDTELDSTTEIDGGSKKIRK